MYAYIKCTFNRLNSTEEKETDFKLRSSIYVTTKSEIITASQPATFQGFNCAV